MSVLEKQYIPPETAGYRMAKERMEMMRFGGDVIEFVRSFLKFHGIKTAEELNARNVPNVKTPSELPNFAPGDTWLRDMFTYHKCYVTRRKYYRWIPFIKEFQSRTGSSNKDTDVCLAVLLYLLNKHNEFDDYYDSLRVYVAERSGEDLTPSYDFDHEMDFKRQQRLVLAAMGVLGVAGAVGGAYMVLSKKRKKADKPGKFTKNVARV